MSAMGLCMNVYSNFVFLSSMHMHTHTHTHTHMHAHTHTLTPVGMVMMDDIVPVTS